MLLLALGNPKVAKGAARGYLTAALHLAPARLSGHNVCPASTPGCRAACLNKAGRGGIFVRGETTNTIQTARLRRTRWFFADRAAFMAQLALEIASVVRKAKREGLTPAFRLNATSDIRWERVPVNGAPNIMTLFPNVQFYDYTKIANRRDLPSNYHITFSASGDNAADAAHALASGRNVAVVFRTKAHPSRYMGAPTFNGDQTDLRFLDPPGHVIALYAKGPAKRDTTGFVVSTL